VDTRTAAFYPAEVLGIEQDGTYILKYSSGQTMSSAVECVFPYENPVDFGAEEIPARVRCMHYIFSLAFIPHPCQRLCLGPQKLPTFVFLALASPARDCACP
jgi:hypothetical protein